MPIYNSLYSNLARQGFAKTFTHGYAQSVVAATHPQVYASNNRPGFCLHRRSSKLGNHSSYHFQNAFHSSAQSSSSTVVQEARPEKHDAGLDAYFDAWKKQHAVGEPEKEWTQFQFPKRIEWKPSSIEVDNAGQTKLETKDAIQESPKLGRVYTSSAVEDIKKVQLGAEEEAALAKIDAAIEKEIKSRNDQAVFEAELSVVAARVPTPVDSIKSPTHQESGFQESPISSATFVSTAAELQSQSYADHLTKLSEAERYAEIPAVFEAMLVADIQPTATAYNALLDAAIHLPAETIQVVPKALDVYSDMLRRKVLPNTTTYNTL